MVSIAVCNCPEFSHTVATLPLVRSLVEAGAHVRIFSYTQFSDYLDKTGAEVCYIDEIAPDEHSWRKGVGDLLDVEVLRFKQCRLVSTPILEEFKRIDFDLVITEQICLWGKLLAARFNLPMVVTSTVYDPSHHHDEFQRMVSKSIRRRPAWSLIKFLRVLLIAAVLSRKFRVSHKVLSDLFHKREADLYIHYIPKEPFYLDEPNHEKIHMAPDASIRRACEGSFELPDEHLGRHKIYVSMGTVHTEMLELLKLLWQAFMKTDYYVIFSLGDVTLDQLPPSPPHYFAKKYVPQLAVLKEADLFITHGGANSFLEGVNSMTPMLGIPQAYDQFYMADMLDELGIGKRIKSDQLNESHIREAVAEIFSMYDSYLNNLKITKQKLCSGMGSAEAAERVISLATKSKERQ